jgi:cysteine-rich repeat protein
MSKLIAVTVGGALVAGLLCCGAEKKAEQQYAAAKVPVPPEGAIGAANFSGEKLKTRGLGEALELDDMPGHRSFFKDAAPICHQTFEINNFQEIAAAGLKTSSSFSCWPSGRCEGFVENAGEPFKIRKIKFGEDTSALEQAFLDRFQEIAQQGLKTLAPTLNETERTFVWRDFMADTQEERDLRDVYKVMSLWSSVTLKWLPCKGESGSACSVQPQVQFAMLAVTPQANSAGDGASCTLFFGVPDETKANGFSKPSNVMRQMKGAVRPSLEGELQKLGTCGDNNIQKRFEECDDGNTSSNDGCSAECKIEIK